MLRIPIDTTGTAYITQTVNVGGVSLAIRLLWNGRDGAWYADFESVNGKNSGVKIVPYSNLLGSSNRVLSPGDGLVVLKDELSQANYAGESVGIEELGTAYGLYYVTADDILVMKDGGLL